MKIYNNGVQGSNPLETGRTQGAAPTGSGHGLAGRKVAGQEGDSVEISGISAHLAEANAADAQQRAARVAHLSALYAKGEYHVNSANLSHALVSQSVGAPEGGQK